MSFSKSIRYALEKGFFHLLSVKLLTQFLGFGTSLMVAKFLTSVELGEIKILQSYAALFIVPAGFGFSAAVLKVCSEKRGESEKEGILRLSLTRSLYSTVISVLLLTFLALGGIVTPSRHLGFWLLVYCAIIPFAVFTDILVVFLQAAKRIKEMARAQAIIKVQSFVFIVLSTWRWGFKGFVFATIAAYVLGLVPLLRQVDFSFLRSAPAHAPSGFYQIAFYSVLANGLGVVGQYTDIFILDHYSGARAEIGYYSLATIFMLAAMQVTVTVQAIVTPYFSENADNEGWLRRKLAATQIRLVAFSVVTAIAVYAIAWAAVPAVYGSEYASTLTYLSVLLIRYVLWSSSAIAGVALFGLGFVHYNLIATAVSTAVGLPLSYVLLGRMGVVGAAWAQVGASAVLFVVVMWLTRLAFRRVCSGSAHRKVQWSD